jgi:hypothetical protein
MNNNRTPWLLTLFIASARSALSLAIGGAFLLYGMSLEDQGMGAISTDIFSFHIMGAIFICLGLAGFAWNIMKGRSKVSTQDQTAEARSSGYDADDAIARYLSSKQQNEDVAVPAPPQNAQTARPIFGRKSS